MKKIRLGVQLLFTIFTNGYLYGFLNGKIYRGGLKYACVPGLNCYSCPGALNSCPIGALQALLNREGFQVPFAALGFFTYHGMTAEQFLWAWLRSELLEPRELRFESSTLYYDLLKSSLEKREKEEYKRHD